MADKVVTDLKAVFDRIEKAVQETVARDVMQRMAQFTVDLVVKRTRLGYGVSKQGGSKAPLKPLSKNYKSFRTKFKKLSPTTTSNKSNLTLTGQMLESVRVIQVKNGSFKFGPSGRRSDSPYSNAQIAAFQEKQGRVFNRVSELEFQQILREYRREFGDLLRKRRLIR